MDPASGPVQTRTPCSRAPRPIAQTWHEYCRMRVSCAYTSTTEPMHPRFVAKPADEGNLVPALDVRVLDLSRRPSMHQHRPRFRVAGERGKTDRPYALLSKRCQERGLYRRSFTLHLVQELIHQET